MRPFTQVVLLALSMLASTSNVVAASAQEVPLATVARNAHLEYAWLAVSRAVQLSGPGIVLVIRPGDNLYEVDDRVEVTAVAPRYTNNDIYVSATLANHITQLARQAERLVSAQEAEAINESNRLGEEIQQAGAAPISGTIVLNVTQLQGTEAVLVTGTAPPWAPVMITLLATLSSDLPNVLLSRHDLTAGSDGKFQAIVPIAPDYVRDSFINVLATSLPGIASAKSQILIHSASYGIQVPFETYPGGIW